VTVEDEAMSADSEISKTGAVDAPRPSTVAESVAPEGVIDDTDPVDASGADAPMVNDRVVVADWYTAWAGANPDMEQVPTFLMVTMEPETLHTLSVVEAYEGVTPEEVVDDNVTVPSAKRTVPG
jgi:hypothetical protein